MRSLRIILLPMACLMLSACTQYFNRYVERTDSIAFSAGDAVASNAAVQIPTPWPRYSNDTKIAFDGAKIRCAVQRYRYGGTVLQQGGSVTQQGGGDPSKISPAGSECEPPDSAGSTPVQGAAPKVY